jgi:hypothetical protein
LGTFFFSFSFFSSFGFSSFFSLIANLWERGVESGFALRQLAAFSAPPLHSGKVF